MKTIKELTQDQYNLLSWFAPYFKDKPKDYILYDLIDVINKQKHVIRG
jgi:hypothetical protein